MQSNFFPRAMTGLRASNLNQQVVVTGGWMDGYHCRDEVLCEVLLMIAFVSRFFSMMLSPKRGNKLEL